MLTRLRNGSTAALWVIWRDSPGCGGCESFADSAAGASLFTEAEELPDGHWFRKAANGGIARPAMAEVGDFMPGRVTEGDGVGYADALHAGGDVDRRAPQIVAVLRLAKGTGDHGADMDADTDLPAGRTAEDGAEEIL